MHPDERTHPGYTWSPLTKSDDRKDHHDRLDFILYKGENIQVKSVDVIGENSENATIIFTPFPSDHRAVCAVFELSN